MAVVTLIETLRKAEEFFTAKKIPSPRLEAQLLFAHFLKLRRIDLFTQGERPLDSAELEVLRAALRSKIAGTPTAYILGSKEFFGRPFTVSPAVLIPRPETEELVEHILSRIQATEITSIVDAGSGSGCIGITLAAELRARELTLLDISAEALALAETNARQLLTGSETVVTTLHADFTKGDLHLGTPADIIASNPPYVLPEEFAGLDESVRDFEPRVALVADTFEQLHRDLAAFAFRNLKPGGLFALETHPQLAAEVAGWVSEAGFVQTEIRNDLAARPHFVLAHR